MGLRQYCSIGLSVGGQPSAKADKGGDRRPTKEEQQKQRRRGIWGWTSPMVEEVTPGQDVFCSFEAKGLPSK